MFETCQQANLRSLFHDTGLLHRIQKYPNRRRR
jgi:hypothetical protein